MSDLESIKSFVKNFLRKPRPSDDGPPPYSKLNPHKIETQELWKASEDSTHKARRSATYPLLDTSRRKTAQTPTTQANTASCNGLCHTCCVNTGDHHQPLEKERPMDFSLRLEKDGQQKHTKQATHDEEDIHREPAGSLDNQKRVMYPTKRPIRRIDYEEGSPESSVEDLMEVVRKEREAWTKI